MHDTCSLSLTNVLLVATKSMQITVQHSVLGMWYDIIITSIIDHHKFNLQLTFIDYIYSCMKKS